MTPDQKRDWLNTNIAAAIGFAAMCVTVLGLYTVYAYLGRTVSLVAAGLLALVVLFWKR